MEEGFKGALAKHLSQEVLLDEFAKAHADRGLQFEPGEISTIPVENARDYLQEALEGRIERAHGQEKQSKALNVDVRQGPRRPDAVKAKKPTHSAGFFAFTF